MGNIIAEINNLEKAVNDFSKEMKNRLAEQAAKMLIDIANFAMMTHKAILENR